MDHQPTNFHIQNEYKQIWMHFHKNLYMVSPQTVFTYLLVNQFTSGILYFFQSPRTGLFSVKIRKEFLAINNIVFVNETESGQPNKRLIHWHFEN